MEDGLLDFAHRIKQHIEELASAQNEQNTSKIFVDTMAGYLQEAEEIGNYEVCDYKRTGIQVNGFAINENENNYAIDLFVSLHTQFVPPLSIQKSDWDAVIKRGIGFIKKSLAGLHYAIVDDPNAYSISMHIKENQDKISLFRVFFFTDGITKTIQLDEIEIEGIPVNFFVWDIERLYRMKSSGRKKEPLLIDLENKYESVLPCLSMPLANEDYESYLIVIPGILLASIYQDYGERIIERNVRSFLQFRGINKEIKKTILREPHMFLAYNNGISATAEQIEFSYSDNGTKSIKTIKDLQIVNGGQTTASIYHASKKDKADISKVFVQMKLTVIKDTDKMDEMVPAISQCANTQNKIQGADFLSNSPYHRKMEHFSRNEWAPAKEGTHRQTMWFYERARGQYLDLIGKEPTKAKKNAFGEKYPKKQLFTKTDLAKYIVTWDQLPHIVSRGNQKNFDYFTKTIKDIDVDQLEMTYYYQTIAKAIIFNTITEMVTTKNRANIVTYTMAWLSYKIKDSIDLQEIWKKQSVPLHLEGTIRVVINAALKHITNSPNGEIYSEWSKKEECWISFRDMNIEEFLAL